MRDSIKQPLDRDRLTVRDATVDDAGVVAEIFNETIVTQENTMDLTLKSPADMADRIQRFDEREVILVLERDDEAIGWGIIQKYSYKFGYRFAAETSVFLRHAEIRKGYGSFLKSAVIERSRELGYRHLVARIWASNEASIAYNLRFGYEIVGIQRDIGFAGGQWRDVAVMQLVLSDKPECDRGTENNVD